MRNLKCDFIVSFSAWRDGYLPDHDPECEDVHDSDSNCNLPNYSLSCFTHYMSKVTITDDKCNHGVAMVQCCEFK